MNESTSSTTMEQSDSRYFSQRAKHISLLNEQSTSVFVKQPSSEIYFQFSNRTYMPITDTQLTPVGRGHGNSISNDHRQIISAGRGRTTVPLSSFILQKDNLSPPSTTTTISSPIFVMHDEVQFVRPYFGPPRNNDIQPSSTSQKREILLSALKEIESGLKTL
ncbi:unnamed protein product [Rotaria sp. Silwood2]|nr:unnamed protein product [Rotaria sp. Silwood2]CAF2622535.1 unnamed protein product [Rotaria sp. Silwood2]CAF2890291.1 unnamed protein product [Rotaria sp. Silwood2]CAF3028866.1 unnamed protein product [Rotaria sp. Silwood2]CAF4257575.1 unnamed protein product [Rotaria sp. Silwood2]